MEKIQVRKTGAATRIWTAAPCGATVAPRLARKCRTGTPAPRLRLGEPLGRIPPPDVGDVPPFGAGAPPIGGAGPACLPDPERG